MAAKLTDEERRLRRMERARLLAFLVAGGALTPEPIPPDGTAWTRLTRSGSPFSDRAVQRLLKRESFIYRSDMFVVKQAPDGRLRVVEESF